MNDLNDYSVIGRLTRDLGERDFAYIGNGTAKADLSIAVNRSVKRNNEWQEEVSYLDVIVWGKTAENLKPFFAKGKQIAIRGHLKQDRWEKDGQKHSRVYIVAEDVQLLGVKDKNGGNSNGGSYQNNYNYGGGTPQFTPAANNAGHADMGTSDDGFPEDIPF
jgi:single-strand DNA-binding protein